MNHSDNSLDKSSPVFEDIAAEHAKMPHLLGELHGLIKGREAKPATIAKAIDSFVLYLRDHFKHEDEGGFFDEIATRAPRLLDRASKVSGEHVELLRAMESFRELAENGGGGASWWDEMDQEYHRVMKELMHHEQQERELLQETFMDDIGTGD